MARPFHGIQPMVDVASGSSIPAGSSMASSSQPGSSKMALAHPDPAAARPHAEAYAQALASAHAQAQSSSSAPSSKQAQAAAPVPYAHQLAAAAQQAHSPVALGTAAGGRIALADPAAASSPSSASPLLPAASPISLLASSVPAQLHGQPSGEIAAALAAHYAALRAEWAARPAGGHAYTGAHGAKHDGADIAAAIAAYAAAAAAAAGGGVGAAGAAHGVEVPRVVRLATSANAVHADGVTGRDAWSSWGFRAALARAPNADGSYTIDGANFKDAPFSFASTVQSLYWAQVIYCIVWIVSGALLLFQGLASFRWLSRLGARGGARERSAILPSGQRVRARPALLAGGVGGCVVGFLLLSDLFVLLLCAVCARSGKARAPLSPQAFFAIWLVPPLVLGAGIAGHWRIAARAATGLLAGASAALLLTAVFGVHTLNARIVVLCVFSALFTAPLVLAPSTGAASNGAPHAAVRHLLAGCTALIGAVTLLQGVTLFAPPEDSSAAWLDLWALLFARDGSATQAAAISAWGTPAFKGYIAGAALAAAAGTAAQLLVAARTGADAMDEWNDYLGGWTERYVDKSGAGGGALGMGAAPPQSRAGLFEPAPSGWQRLASLLNGGSSSGGASAQRPASYGGRDPLLMPNSAASPAGVAAAFTELNPARRARSSRSPRTSAGPARFHALARGEKDAEAFELSEQSDADDADDAASDAASDETTVDKDTSGSGLKHKTSGEKRDGLAELKKGLPWAPAAPLALALPRPPSYRTDSAASSSTAVGSGLSGSTKASTPAASSDAKPDPLAASPTAQHVHRPAAVYREAGAAAAGASAAPGAGAAGAAPANLVPATPSLINAITRIQQAQAQAQAWKAAQAASPSSASGPAAATAAAPGGSGAAPFDRWWDKEVGGKK